MLRMNTIRFSVFTLLVIVSMLCSEAALGQTSAQITLEKSTLDPGDPVNLTTILDAPFRARRK